MLPNPPPIQNAVVDNAGKSTQFWTRWFTGLGTVIGTDGSFRPPTLTDTAAQNNSVYYSSTASKLVYKDAAGVIHALY